MNTRQEYLRLRRARLIAQAAEQRGEVSAIVAQLRSRLRWMDIGFAVGQTLRMHPVLTAAGASLLLRAHKGKQLSWPGRLFTAWELFNILRKQWSKRNPQT